MKVILRVETNVSLTSDELNFVAIDYGDVNIVATIYLESICSSILTSRVNNV